MIKFISVWIWSKIILHFILLRIVGSALARKNMLQILWFTISHRKENDLNLLVIFKNQFWLG